MSKIICGECGWRHKQTQVKLNSHLLASILFNCVYLHQCRCYEISYNICMQKCIFRRNRRR